MKQTSEIDPSVRRRNAESARRQLEFILWMMGAAVTAFFILTQASNTAQWKSLTLLNRDLLWAIIPVLTPVVFLLIFGNLPIASLHDYISARSRSSANVAAAPAETPGPLYINIKIGPETEEVLTFDKLSVATPTMLYAYYASNSRWLAKSLFARAGVYLFIGVIIAFSGLVFFYTQTSPSTESASTPDILMLMQLAPKFGILFFIELVAFFFLRQYRAAMDEFRYFEEIQRRREEVLAMVRLSETSSAPLTASELLKSIGSTSNAKPLEAGQTTEIIESRKLEKNEIELLEKIVSTIAK